MLGTDELFHELRVGKRTGEWCAVLEDHVRSAFSDSLNGNQKRWEQALVSLPEVTAERVCFKSPAVTCSGSLVSDQESAIRSALMRFAPWRKGPFQIFDTFIDTEWRSNLKWDRLESHLHLGGKDILDVGCGNGYYGWRMLGAGARRVVGLEPYLLYVMQYAALRRYLGDVRNYVLPAGDMIIPANLRLFDVVFSMGVLYHRKSPIEHLQLLGHALKQGGELVLETLVIEGYDHQVLIPQDRYAQMNNVWFLPTCSLLERMLRRCGFSEIEVVDVTQTTTDEQRTTEWMTFESLEKFLSPRDRNLTIEGYPAPLRAIVLARKG
jgi:tRNA (mo5U34)-methyltransferase